MSGDAGDLSGVWYGRYDAIGYAETNSFIVQLEQTGSTLSGIITEPDTGSAGAVRRAFVSGRRSGSAIEFTKQYDGGRFAHAVRYWGMVDAEGTEIAGRWMIVREQGTFVMTRETFSAEELEEEREVELTER